MRDNEAIWKGKTDEEVFEAARRLRDYTVEGQQIIRAELRRRGMSVDDDYSTAQSPLESSAVQNHVRDSKSPIVNRYRDAYRVAASLVGLGVSTKIFGFVIAAIVIVVSMGAVKSAFGGATIAGVFLAAMIGGFFWVCGVIVAAQGQILRATLDNAVAGSPFLSDSERREAMGIPKFAA